MNIYWSNAWNAGQKTSASSWLAPSIRFTLFFLNLLLFLLIRIFTFSLYFWYVPHRIYMNNYLDSRHVIFCVHMDMLVPSRSLTDTYTCSFLCTMPNNNIDWVIFFEDVVCIPRPFFRSSFLSFLSWLIQFEKIIVVEMSLKRALLFSSWTIVESIPSSCPCLFEYFM